MGISNRDPFFARDLQRIPLNQLAKLRLIHRQQAKTLEEWWLSFFSAIVWSRLLKHLIPSPSSAYVSLLVDWSNPCHILSVCSCRHSRQVCYSLDCELIREVDIWWTDDNQLSLLFFGYTIIEDVQLTFGIVLANWWLRCIFCCMIFYPWLGNLGIELNISLSLQITQREELQFPKKNLLLLLCPIPCQISPKEAPMIVLNAN